MYLVIHNGEEFKTDSIDHLDAQLRAAGVGVPKRWKRLRKDGYWLSGDERTSVAKVDGRTIPDVQWLG
ncbi:MAG TPA: hypothetical protein PLB89_18195 [Flavobacteriales bacterium]|nr:hypothetical protein [Flavobacteriales bacterium]